MQIPVLIIDGHNLLFRGYYGVPKGAVINSYNVNAVFGFFALLRQLIETFGNSNMLIVFDTETGVQHKLQQQPDYKQGRVYEQDIFVQLDLIKRILQELNIYENFNGLPSYYKAKLAGKQDYLQETRKFLTMVPQTLPDVTSVSIIEHYSNNSVNLPFIWVHG